ncbi:DUF2726 domain-containing protein [Flavobacterium branchiophilum]|uniref:DUF2726 domain-containing protein n=1 Tax=Flavobacterium branchiophilum TaxID=55197 RepID=A0A2H3KAW9_9FLAO|nr:DUF2726 domain-containing protein [Flavobacterium branchiophilum]PDS22677.1 hypothetical protein B0A77_12790 [Flavobacterium branchiophilum]
MRDTVLKYLQHQNFDKIIEVLRDNKTFDELMKDEIFRIVFFQNFTNELFNQTELKLSYPAFLLNCHDSKDYAFKLNENDEERILMFLFEKTAEVNYAKRLPKHEPAIEIVKKDFEKLKTESEQGLIRAQKQKNFKVVEQFANNNESLIKSIFNSPQEKEFYLACKEIFTSYIILPNVSLTTIFNQNLVRNQFSKYFDFYLKSSIDFVIVEEETFIPILFIELDSKTFHNKNSSGRDNIKNELFDKLGYDLIRITKKTGKEGIKEFSELLEVIKKEKNIA